MSTNEQHDIATMEVIRTVRNEDAHSGFLMTKHICKRSSLTKEDLNASLLRLAYRDDTEIQLCGGDPSTTKRKHMMYMPGVSFGLDPFTMVQLYS